MKAFTRSTVSFVLGIVFALALAIGGIALAATTYDDAILYRSGVSIAPVGKTGTATNGVYVGCDVATDALGGTWSSRSTSTSTSEDITVTGATAGDSCVAVLGAASAATKQALVWTCEVSAANTATLHVTNASGGSLTPGRGKHCARVFNP